MKILFAVQAIDYIDPVGIMQISALARMRGHSTHLGILSRENIIEKVRTLKPDMVAYGGSTGEHKYYIDANKRIKSEFPEVFTLMGGPHATFCPEVIEQSSLDAICVGEGDEAFPDILAKVERGEDFSTLKNIVTRNGKTNGVRDLYQDLDHLPFPDRALFYETTELGRWPLKSFMASRGCPYSCTYCFNHVFRKLYHGKGKIIRRHSVDYVIEEVLAVKRRYPLQFVKFYDDIFTYQVDDWLEDFARKYKARIGLPFHCLTRADLMTEDMAKVLKEAGCRSISMSIEAGNEHIRNDTLKRGMSEEQIVEAFHVCRKQGINTFSNNILALPYSTIQNDIETLDLNIKARVSFAEFPIFHPYPKTELGDYCVEKGIYTPDYGGLHMSYMNKSPLSCFTEKEKNMQRNLSTLGLLVIWFPRSRNLVVNHLIHLPYNRLYFLTYYVLKVYLNKTRIYPMRLGFRGFWRALRKSLKLESFKKTDESLAKAQRG